MPRPRPVTAILAALAIAVSAAGCVSMPNGGPVQSYPATQSATAQGQSYLQLIPKPPVPNGSPTQIVLGFLAASASFADGQRLAKEFLTPEAGKGWKPTWSATVFSGAGPQVSDVVPSPARRQATVTISGDVQAELSASGAYAVPSASGTSAKSVTFRLTQSAGQWRIETPPRQLLLTSVEFSADYQLRNLYFLDPGSRFLVPDPVYVPLQTTPANLLNGLVKDLISPPGDWLAGGTHSAFPQGTKLLSDVVVNGGAAEVNLGGSIAKLSDDMREQVSAQLLSTLSGSGQGQPLVRSVVLAVNGKAWSPSGAQQNPVQHSTGVLQVPTGASTRFYYLDRQGTVWASSGASGNQVKVQRIGTGFSAIAVSPDTRYLAAVRDGQLFTGRLGSPLVKRAGTGYTTVSWDASDDVWAITNGQAVVLDGDVTAKAAQSQQGSAVPVDVVQPDGEPESGPITAVRVAPDGVRVAFIIGGATQTLAFGAIVQPAAQPQSPGQPQFQRPRPQAAQPDSVAQINLAPLSVSGGNTGFSAVSWYGPDSVITLGAKSGLEGPALTEYSVNGGQATTITADPGIQSLTTSSGSLLIAGAKGGVLLADASTSGAWAPIGNGIAPAYPG